MPAKGDRGTLMAPVMTRTHILLGAVLVALSLPGVARADIATSETRRVAVAASAVTDVAAPPTFDLVGLRWRGSGRVELRTRSTDGSWSPWQDAAPEPDDRPDAGSPEGQRGIGWTMGNPWWVGPSDRLRLRAHGDVRSLHATFVRSPELRVPLRALASTAVPAIVPRSGWAADESIRRGEPTVAAEIRFAVVHHTAGTNGYSRSQAAAIVRGIQLFHVSSNGWNDIGYNFLVDRFGTIYEGRFGGVDQNVVGAHAQGFNTGSVGVALLGTYTSSAPSAAAEQALASLLAWRLDLAHVDPLGLLTVPSGGNERFPAGVPVQLRTVSGHRDTGFTVCPGDALYSRLGELATRTAATGAPKVYAPTVEGTVGGTVRFRARLSEALPWTVVVKPTGGREVARGTGSSRTVDWTWDSAGLPLREYQWEITAGSGGRSTRPVSGTIGAPAEGLALEFLGASADPETITPNGDGQSDVSTVTFTLSAPATVAATVVDETDVELVELASARWRRAGTHTLEFDGAGLPDGRYAVRLVARSAIGDEAEARVPVSVSRTLEAASVTPTVFSPNGDGRADRVAVRFRLTQEAAVTVRVFRDDRWVATPFTGTLAAGQRMVRWDGTKRKGRLRDGPYTAALEVTDAVSTIRSAFEFASDTTPPRVRLLSRTPPRLSVSEPATLVINVNGSRRRLQVAEAGSVAVAGVKTVRTLRVTGRDSAGNVSAPLSVR